MGKGYDLTLSDVLYIPTATVQLISVQCLAHDSKVTAHFNSSNCWLTNASGAVITHGTLAAHRTFTAYP
jgi:hypothetical protein